MSDLTLNTKEYGGRGVANGISRWLNTAAGLISAFASATASVTIPTAAKRTGAVAPKAHVKWNLKMPIVTEEASSCACPGDAIDEIDAYIQVRISSGVSETVRTDFALQLKDLVATPEFQASIISLSQPTA